MGVDTMLVLAQNSERPRKPRDQAVNSGSNATLSRRGSFLHTTLHERTFVSPSRFRRQWRSPLCFTGWRACSA